MTKTPDTTTLSSLWDDEELMEENNPEDLSASRQANIGNNSADISQLRYDPSTLDQSLVRTSSSNKRRGISSLALGDHEKTPNPFDKKSSAIVDLPNKTQPNSDFSRDSSPTSVRAGLKQSFNASIPKPSEAKATTEYSTVEIPEKALEERIRESEIDAFFDDQPIFVKPSSLTRTQELPKVLLGQLLETELRPGEIISANSLRFQNVLTDTTEINSRNKHRKQSVEDLPDISYLVEPLSKKSKEPVTFTPDFFSIDGELEVTEESTTSQETDELIEI